MSDFSMHSGIVDPSTGPVPIYNPRRPKVAVIGGGMAGLACARSLHEAGIDVVVFDKGRGAGGRMSTRRAGDAHFDHGAQYFTVRDARFDARVQQWLEAGIVDFWRGRLASLPEVFFARTPSMIDRYVGVPGMSAILRHMANGLDVRYGTRVTRLSHEQDHWWLETEDGPVDEFFVAAVLAVPAPQAVPLLEAMPAWQRRVEAVQMAPTWAAMVAFETHLDLPFDGAFVDGSPLSWVARNNSKPGRPELDCWVLHATAEWSEQHLDDDPGQANQALLEAFAKAAGRPLPEIHSSQIHRWRFARTMTPLNEPCLFDGAKKFGVCGDWCPGARIEGAYLSGLSVAEGMLDHLEQGAEARPFST